MPIYVLACLQVLAVGFFCARYGQRALVNIFMMCIGVAGYIMLLASRNLALSYVAIYVAATGIYACIPNTIALTGSSIEGAYKKSVVTGFVISFGNLNGAVTSGAIYRTSDQPYYRLGHGIVLLYIGIGIITSGVYYFGLRRENALREQGTRDEVILDASLPLEERRRLAADAHAKRIEQIRSTSSWIPFYKQYMLLRAQTHSLPGGTYTSLRDAREKKGDDWSGHRYNL